MEAQIPDQVKNERSGRLMRLARLMSQEYRQSFAGEKAEVLYEEAKMQNGEIYQIGHTVRYIKTGRKTQEALRNRILTETLTEDFLDDMVLVQAENGNENH